MVNNEIAAKTETALAKYENFRLPDLADGEFSAEELSEDMAGIQVNFPRIKIPSGGSLQFELPGGNPEDPDYSKTLEGVILYTHSANAYWVNGGYDEDENGPPNCSSVDGVSGVGVPGGMCAVCPMNAWNSGANGKGKACKNMRHLYFLRDGDFIPVLISLSPTSLRPYNDFASSCFIARRRGSCGSVVQIGLKRMNNGKDDYSVATFKKLYDFTGEKLASIRSYADGFKQQIKVMLVQQAVEAESRTAISDLEDGAIVDAEFSDTAAMLAMANVGAGDLPL
jgi:hypothetical protein